MLLPFRTISLLVLLVYCLVVVSSISVWAQPTLYIEEYDRATNRCLDQALNAHLQRHWVVAARKYQRVIEEFPAGVRRISLTLNFKSFTRQLQIIRDFQAHKFAFQNTSPHPGKFFIPEIFARYGEIITLAQLRQLVDCYRKQGALGLLKSMENELYVGCREYAILRLAQMPAEGREAYRLLVDGKAQRLYQEGERLRRKAPLEKVARLYPLSSVGASALNLLGNLYFQEGRLDRAVFAWQRLLQLNLLTDTKAQALVVAKLLLARYLMGESLQRLLDEPLVLLYLSPAKRTAIFNTPIVIGGQRFKLADYLKKEVKRWHPCWPDPGKLTNWGRDGSHNNLFCGLAVPLADLQLYCKLKPYHQHLGGQQLLRRFRPRFHRTGRPLSDSAGSPYYPLCVDGYLYLNGPLDACCLDLSTKRIKWRVHNPRSMLRFMQRDRFSSLYTATIAGDIYYVVFDNFTDSSQFSQAVGDKTASSNLYAIDRLTGKILWCTDKVKYPHEEEWASLFFNTAPVVVGNRLFIGGTVSTSETKAYVFAFDARNGKLLWKRFVCSKLEHHPGDVRRLPVYRSSQGTALATRHGLLFYCTNIGALAALEMEQGYIHWLVKYEPPNSKIRIKLPLPSQQMRPPNLPPIIQGMYMYVVPADLGQLLVYRACTGELCWRYPENIKVTGPLYLIGIGPRGKILLGGREIVALDRQAHISSTLWRCPLPLQSPGSACLDPQGLTMVTHWGIYRLQLATGKITVKMLLKLPRQANIAIVDCPQPLVCPACRQRYRAPYPQRCPCGQELTKFVPTDSQRYFIVTGRKQFCIYRQLIPRSHKR